MEIICLCEFEVCELWQVQNQCGGMGVLSYVILKMLCICQEWLRLKVHKSRDFIPGQLLLPGKYFLWG